MHRKYFSFVLALTAFCLALILFYFFGQVAAPKKIPENVPTAPVPFPYITGVGIVEPVSGNIYIGIPFNRIVKQINVAVNDPVKTGDVLLELDHADLKANREIKQQEYERALTNLQKLEALPRQEDLFVAQEEVKKAHLAFAEAKVQYEMVNNLTYPQAISQEERNKRHFRYQQAEADLRDTQAKYEKIKSGTWKPDLKIAQHQVEQAKADIEAIQTEIQRMFIKSPIDGTVLQMRLHEGETPHSDPSHADIIVGNIDELHLRVSVDQYNVSNLPIHASAIAYRQGDHTVEFPLEFVHIEPFMIPKKYLTNAVDEQVDSQVFEILFRIAKKNSGLLIGEQMDVYIEKK